MTPFRYSPLPIALAMAAAAGCLGLPAVLNAAISISSTPAEVSPGPYLRGSNLVWYQGGLGTVQKTANGSVVTNPLAVNSAIQYRLSMIRFFGGEQYFWRDGVGPSRPKRLKLFDKWASDNTFGTDELVSYANATGSQLLMVVPYRATLNFYEDNAPYAMQLAANWVEYCNGVSPGLDYGQARGWKPTVYLGEDPNKFEFKVSGSWLCTEEAPAGYFAWLREYFGHREPYKVRYWEIGNETYLSGPTRANKAWADPALYAQNFVKFVDAMKAKDPTIQVGAQAWMHNIAIDDPARWSEGYRWNAAVLGVSPGFTAAYAKADFLSTHEYLGPIAPNPDNLPAEYQQLYDAVHDMDVRLARLKSYYDKPVIMTEYNVQYGVFGGSDPKYRPHQHRLKSALAMVMMQNVFMRQSIYGACQYHFLDLRQAVSDPTFRMVYDELEPVTRARRQGVTAPFEALKLYGEYAVGRELPVEVAGHPGLDAVAYRTASGDINLLVVNPTASAQSAPLSLDGFVPAQAAEVVTLTGAGPEAESVSISSASTSLGTLSYTFPAWSLTILTLAPAVTLNTPDAGALVVSSALTPENPSPGDTLAYTVNCTNTHSSVINNAVVSFRVPRWLEVLPGTASPAASYSPQEGVLSWMIPKMAAGEKKTLTCQVRVR